jgi:hypothetical protein
MTNDKPESSVLDLTADGVEFAPWSTIVENDDLHLGRVSFEIGSPLITFNQEGVSYGLPPAGTPQPYELEATFVSIEKSAVIRFSFNDVIAFRVLDENGLLEVWGASAATPRPAHTTFRARGHAWANESVLVFWDGGNRARYSYFVATMDWCLEVVSYSEPEVAEIGPAIVTKSEGAGS